MTNSSKTLAPIMTGAEVMERPQIFQLCTGEEIRCDPKNEDSLNVAKGAIIDAAVRMGIDGRVMFTAAARQLGDIEATLAALPVSQ